MTKLFKNTKPIPSDAYSVAVSLSGIISQEGTMTEGGFEHILKNVSFEVKKGEVLGIYGENYSETRLILEILANLRPYYGGKCVLIERGMMKDKRYILPQLFFFDNRSMLFENMTVLEYAAFTQNQKTREYAKKQKALLEQLVALGMGYISLTPINTLSRPEKMLVQLYAAFLTKSNIIVADLSKVVFNQKELTAIGNIAKLIAEHNLAFVFSTVQPDLIAACSKKYIKIENGISSEPLSVKKATITQKFMLIKKQLEGLLAEEKTSKANAAKRKIKNHIDLIDGAVQNISEGMLYECEEPEEKHETENAPAGLANEPCQNESGKVPTENSAARVKQKNQRIK